jgi:hypothetical protein
MTQLSASFKKQNNQFKTFSDKSDTFKNYINKEIVFDSEKLVSDLFNVTTIPRSLNNPV